MSILEKLKNLVATIEDADNGETTEIEKEAIQQQVASLLNEQEAEETDEVTSFLAKERLLKISLAEKLLQFEKVKQVAESEMVKNRTAMLQKLNDLRLEYGVPDEGYSVQLPSSPEDKVSFQKD